jgi:hypothetical protein
MVVVPPVWEAVVGIEVAGRDRSVVVVDWVARRAFHRCVRFGGAAVVLPLVIGRALGGGQAATATGRGAVASRASWIASSVWRK